MNMIGMTQSEIDQIASDWCGLFDGLGNISVELDAYDTQYLIISFENSYLADAFHSACINESSDASHRILPYAIQCEKMSFQIHRDVWIENSALMSAYANLPDILQDHMIQENLKLFPSSAGRRHTTGRFFEAQPAPELDIRLSVFERDEEANDEFINQNISHVNYWFHQIENDMNPKQKNALLLKMSQLPCLPVSISVTRPTQTDNSLGTNGSQACILS
jgi:hypothetical protein